MSDSPPTDSPAVLRPPVAPDMPAAETAVVAPIVARAGTWYRVARFIMVALLLGFAIWFARDGFYRYPREEKANEQKRSIGEKQPFDTHSDFDIAIQKLLAVFLPPLAAAALAWTLYNSRGEYRLEEGTFSAPGHPPVKLEAIARIDRRMWDRKGIAYLYYQQADGTEKRIRLDDFVYDRDPTDLIFERIEQSFITDQSSPADASAPIQQT